jgi:acetyltransferase-like isoleucine patch superfamily enzyme
MIRTLLRKIRNRFRSSTSKSFYNLGDGVVMIPNGIRISHRTRTEPRTYVNVGSKCIINADFIFETEKGYIELGNNVHIGGATFICRSEITVGNDVTMAWGITIYDHDSHSVMWEKRKNDNHQCYDDFRKYNGNNIMQKDWSHVNSKPINIKDKAWLGFDVTVLKGVTIGEGAVVGAKAVVTRDVPDWCVVAGNPARIIKYLND